MKRFNKLFIATLLTTFLLSSLNSIAVAATPKNKCSRVGQIVVEKAIKYQCILVKGKRLWVRLQGTTTSKVTSSDQTTPTNNVQTPSVDPVLSTVSQALNAQVLKADLEQVDESKIGLIVAEQGLDPGNVSAAKRMLRQIYLAQDIFNLKEPPVVILATSIEFIKSEFAKYCPQRIDWFPNEVTTMEKWEQWAFVGCLDSRAVQVVPLPSSGIPVDHIEGAIGSDLGYLPIGLGANTPKLPTWFVRGLKGVVAEYATSIGGSTWKNRKMPTINCQQVTLKEISYSYEYVAKNYCDTPLGQAVSRYLVSLMGLKPTLAFINELQRTGVWSDKIFEDFIGIPFDQFERDAKDYAARLDAQR